MVKCLWVEMNSTLLGATAPPGSPVLGRHCSRKRLLLLRKCLNQSRLHLKRTPLSSSTSEGLALAFYQPSSSSCLDKSPWQVITTLSSGSSRPQIVCDLSLSWHICLTPSPSQWLDIFTFSLLSTCSLLVRPQKCTQRDHTQQQGRGSHKMRSIHPPAPELAVHVTRDGLAMMWVSLGPLTAREMLYASQEGWKWQTTVQGQTVLQKEESVG